MFRLFYDSTYILVLIGVLITLFAQVKLQTTFSKYEKVRSARGLSGKDVAEQIIRMYGLKDVTVRMVRGHLSDHYDPRSKTVNLSEATYNKTSIAALGVAAHECGHALQHENGYAPLNLRTSLVPVANLGSMAAVPLIIVGLFISGETSVLIINLGLIAFSLSVLFQIVTLPVEFDASKRALAILSESGILLHEEAQGTKKVLNAAALTYVAAVAASVLQLLRLVLLTSGRRD